MSDIILHAGSYAQTLTARTRAAVERLRDEESGQDLIEYAGVLVVVAALIAIVATLATTSIGPEIGKQVKNLVDQIFSSSSSSGH